MHLEIKIMQSFCLRSNVWDIRYVKIPGTVFVNFFDDISLPVESQWEIFVKTFQVVDAWFGEYFIGIGGN